MRKTTSRKITPKQEQTSGGVGLRLKGNLLLALPVVVQAILLIALSVLSSNADQSAIESGLLKEKARICRTLLLQSQFVSACIDAAILTNQPIDQKSRLFADLAQASAERAKPYFAKSPPGLTLVNAIESETVSLLQDANYCYLLAQVNARRQHLNTLTLAGSTDFIKVRAKQAKLLQLQQMLQDFTSSTAIAETPVQQGKRRFWFGLAVGGTFVNLLALILAAALFNSTIVKRLSRLAESVSRFGRGQKILPPTPGNDEIATLDRNFYQLSSEMSALEQTQRTLFETVDCLLCQVDKLGRIEQANSAAKQLLGQSPSALKGKYVEDLVPVDDRKSAIEFITKAIQDGTQPPFELPICKPDGSLIYTLWTARYVAEHKRVFCVVQDATERIEAERVRKQVLQMVSHDLRSPLSSIGLIYKMMDAGHIVALDPGGREALSQARANTTKMLAMVNNLLDIEKMEAGMLQLELEPVIVSEACALAVENVQDLIAAKQITVDYRLAKDRVMADKFRLVQILTNLLSNAIKHSNANSQVTIATQPGNGYLKVSVSDQGSGIDSGQQKSIFDQYKVSELNDARPQKGMGLVICRALVHLHGGEIAFESGPGNGTTFYFSLPDQSYNIDNKF